MKRAIDAMHEWMQLRTRMRDEHRFHLDRAVADCRALGLSTKAAKQAARRRFGSRQYRNLALRELGGDWAGLIRMFLAHRVYASALFQPMALVVAGLLILLLSPAPRPLLEVVAGLPLDAKDRDAVFISQTRNLAFIGVSNADFASIRSLDSLTALERYQSIHARAQAKKGVTIAALESLVRTKTGNPRLRVVPLLERQAILMGPAKAVWGFLAFCSLFFVAAFIRKRRWIAYGLAGASLHALVSLMTWALAVQLWNRVAWSTDGRALLGFLLLSGFYLGVIALQWHIWWQDLRQRCPLCLESLLLPLTEGSADCFLVNPATTESVCAHGHGVLVETRWSSDFQPHGSPLQGLLHG